VTPLDLETVYRAHVQRVARWASRLGGPDFDVEDAVQETFLIAQRKLPSFRQEAAVATWLYKIVENVVRHRKRKQRWRRLWADAFSSGPRGGASSGGSDDGAEPLEPLVARLPSPERSPSERLEQREQTRMLYRLLDQLPERQRAVLVLFELEGHTGEEIAALLGAKVATVWVWLHRARATCAKRLREQGEQPEPVRETLRQGAPAPETRSSGPPKLPPPRRRREAKESVP
jgi:RNA polymerase sigma-70 factor, ECF subfamily